MSPNLPPWLRASLTPPHLEATLDILQARESAREVARSVSRKRLSLVPPTTTPDSRSQFSPNEIAHYSVSYGSQLQNQLHNRYLDMEPYDRTRVSVVNDEAQSRETDNDVNVGSRYINANWVRELFGGKWWIATQAPLPQSTHVFLSLFFQPITYPPPHAHPESKRTTRIRTTVQLTQNFEHGRRKAHAYFPSVVGQSYVVSPEAGYSAPLFNVTLLESRTVHEAQCIISTVSINPISNSGSSGEPESQPVIFRHFLYGAWPDHGIPQKQDRPGFLEFIRLVDRTNKDISLDRRTGEDSELDPDPPIIVHCSAGVGRTGAFIALSSLLRAHGRLSPASAINHSAIHIPAPHELHSSPLGALPDAINDDLVAQEVDTLREQRPSMVQRDEQVLLIYDIVAGAFHC